MIKAKSQGSAKTARKMEPPLGHEHDKVELRGIEPLAFSLRTRRATNCATAPCMGRLAETIRLRRVLGMRSSHG
jgi:hypothetical protein